MVKDIKDICIKRNGDVQHHHDANMASRSPQKQHQGDLGDTSKLKVAIQKGCIVKAVSTTGDKRPSSCNGHGRKITVMYAIHNVSSQATLAGQTDAGDASSQTTGPSKLHALHADMVLVTLPLGVLQQSVPETTRHGTTIATQASATQAQVEDGIDRKHAAVTFSPPLSLAKQEAIHALGMGLENKVLLRFPISIDEVDHTSNATVSDHQSLRADGGTSVHRSQLDPSPFIRRLQKLKYFQVADPKFRLLSLHGMDQKAKAGCLLVHVAPPHAHTTHRKQQATRAPGTSEYEVVAEILKLLRDIFGPKVYVPQPIEVKVTEWHRDPFALGAYSHMPPNATVMHKHQMLQPEGVATAALPGCKHINSVGDEAPITVDCSGDGNSAWAGRLLFAGEGCSIHAHQCVHGAFETGEAQAMKIIDTLTSLLPQPANKTEVTAGGRKAHA